MRFRGRTKRRTGRSGLLRRRMASRGRMSRTTGAKLSKVYTAAITHSPAKHILFSDNGVTGGAASGFAGSFVTTSGLLMLCNGISRPAGATNVQMRLGDYCWITKIHFNILTSFGTGMTGDQILSWMLVVDNEVQGTIKTPATFFGDYFGVAFGKSNLIPNLNNKDIHRKYRVLKKGSILMKETVGGVVEQHKWNIKWYSRQGIRTSYVLGNNGNGTDIDTGAIYLIMWMDSNVAVQGTSSQLEGNVYFHDQH